MAKTKKVGFNLFKPVTSLENGNEVLIDLAPIFEHVRLQYIDARREVGILNQEYKRVYRYNLEPARLSEISIDVNTQYYHLTFERLNYSLPNRTTLHGDSEMLDLDDDEYIGHEASVLYDPINHILMIQRNRDSLGPTAIASFIEFLVLEAGTANNFSIAMISDDTARRRAFNQTAYRRITTKVVGQKAIGIVERLFDQRPEGIENVEISFNSKSGKNEEIDSDFSVQLLEEYVNDPDVKSLKIKGREYEESPVEPIDLINHKLVAYTTFDLAAARQLNAYRVFEDMVRIYDIEDGGYKNKILRMR